MCVEYSLTRQNVLNTIEIKQDVNFQYLKSVGICIYFQTNDIQPNVNIRNFHHFRRDTLNNSKLSLISM